MLLKIKEAIKEFTNFDYRNLIIICQSQIYMLFGHINLDHCVT